MQGQRALQVGTGTQERHQDKTLVLSQLSENKNNGNKDKSTNN